MTTALLQIIFGILAGIIVIAAFILAGLTLTAFIALIIGCEDETQENDENAFGDCE